MSSNFIEVSGYTINRNEVLMVSPIEGINTKFFFTINFKNNIDLQVSITIDLKGNSKEQIVDGSELSWPETANKLMCGKLKMMDFVRYRDLVIQHEKLIDHLKSESVHPPIST